MGTVYIIRDGKGGTIIMNKFFALINKLKVSNPLINVKFENIPGYNVYKISVANDKTEVFNVVGADVDLLFQNAYGKLTLHRKEII